MFVVSLISVAVMLLYAVPGFLLVKTKLVREQSISAFAVLLMYVCQPVLILYTFQRASYTPELFANIGITFGIGLAVMGVFLGVFYLIYRRKYDDVRFRIANLSVSFGNVTFIGVPLLEALLPDAPEVTIYSSVLFIAMSILCWTVGSTLITRDKKYCKPLKIVLNPAVLALVVALPLFFCKVQLPAPLLTAVTIVGKMSTPLCMIILGMRLATVKIKEFFSDWLPYLTLSIKQIIVPLAALAIVWFLPIDHNLKLALYIMFCCPVGAVVLNFAEMLGDGQKTAANTVMLSTLTAVLTIPLMLLLVQAL